MRAIVATIVAVLLVSFGCSKDPPPKTAKPDPSLARGRLFRLEIESAKAAKTVGSGATDKTLDNLLADHGIVLWTPEKEAQFVYVGLTGAPGSFSTSSYARVRMEPDPAAVRLEPFVATLQLRDGRRLELNIASARITPVGAASDDGVIDGPMLLEAKGGFAIVQGDTRLSGDVTGEWRGGIDKASPEVQIVTPPGGLVTGRVRVFFDKPVHSTSLPERVFLRDAKRTPVEIDVTATPTDIPSTTTEIVITPRSLLPFDARLSVAVGSEIDDLLGRRLDKPVIAMFDTPSTPPLMLGTFHDFAVARGEAELLRVGVSDFVEAFGTLRPMSGRILRLAPPGALATTASAVLTRLAIPSNAIRLELRVCKVARTRDAESPSLTVGLARPSGVLWTLEQTVTEVPRAPFAGPDGEWMGTPWANVTIALDGQRGTEAILLLEARPLTASMNVGMDAQFLIDDIRVVTGL